MFGGLTTSQRATLMRPRF